jgi:hypothetical protein
LKAEVLRDYKENAKLQYLGTGNQDAITERNAGTVALFLRLSASVYLFKLALRI